MSSSCESRSSFETINFDVSSFKENIYGDGCMVSTAGDGGVSEDA